MSVTVAGGTKIEWADFTFNPWWGCAEVSPGCANCYARTWAAFTKASLQLWPPKGAAGKGQEHGFMVTGDANWRKPLRWAREAPALLGHRPRVFCASMADVFEERDELDEQRVRLMMLIEGTPELDWLLLTKRPEFARDWMTRWYDAVDRGNFPAGWRAERPYRNVWMGVSIENSRFTWRADVLREIPAAVRFISAEPLLWSLFDDTQGQIIRKRGAEHDGRGGIRRAAGTERGRSALDLTGIDWVIVGGESGHRARRTDPEWIRELVSRCDPNTPVCCGLGEDGECCNEPVPLGTVEPVPAVFVKQLGAVLAKELGFTDTKGGAIDEWPAEFQIREHPGSAV